MMMSKESHSIYELPEAIRSVFHKSITNFLKEEIPSLDKDWSYKIEDDDFGLIYNLLYFHTPIEKDPNTGFIVIARVGCYDLVKKEMLPPEEDKVIVFRFKTLNELLCQKNQS